MQCFEIAAQARLSPFWADAIDFASGDDEISQVAELRRQEAYELDDAPRHPHGNCGDLFGLAHYFEGQLDSLSLGHDIRPTRFDFDLVALGRVNADLGEIATMDGIHLVAAIANQIGPTSLGHIQDSAHV